MFKIYHFKTLNSTNDKAKAFKENSVIIADEQKKGKGRFKRNWSSEKGGIYISIVLQKISKPQFYTFIACLSALKAINIPNAKVKWPNDIIYNKKKIAGILTEIKENKTIVGIGINTNNTILPDLKQKAISINKIFNKQIKNEIIIKRMLNHLEKYLRLIKQSEYNEIIKDWKKHSFLGSKVIAKTLNNTYSGIAYDLDNDGFLIIKDNKNNKIKIIEGDIILK